MNIHVTLYATLQRHRFDRQTIPIPEGVTILNLLAELKTDQNDVSVLMVNRKKGR